MRSYNHVSNTEQGRSNRKSQGSNKRKGQQSSTMVLSNPAPYEASTTNKSNNQNLFHGNGGSSRAQSKQGANSRKSHSIKHKSSKVQIPVLINFSEGLTPARANIHSRQVTNSANRAETELLGQITNDSSILVDQQHQQQQQHSLQVQETTKLSSFQHHNNSAYSPVKGGRSSSKVNQKHRKLSRQDKDSKTVGESQVIKVKSTAKGGKVQEMTVNTAANGLNMQQMIDKNSFGGQPQFIVAGQIQNDVDSSAKNTQQSAPSGNQIIPVSSNQYPGLSANDASNIFNKEIQTNSSNMRATPQKVTNSKDQKLLQQGKFFNPSNGLDLSPAKNNKYTVTNPDRQVQNNYQGLTQVKQSMDLSRQQQLHQQQLRQQQNFKQHLQNVHLEIKGITSSVPPASSHGIAPSSLQANFGAPKQISSVPQQQIGSNLTSKVSLLRTTSPQSADKPSSIKTQNIFVHHPSALNQKQEPSSPTFPNQSRMVLAPQNEMNNAHLGLLQNSKSPFKQKQSQKLLRSSVNPTQKPPGSSNSTLNSPIVVIKKRGSAKNSMRKQSAKKNAAGQANIYSSANGPPHQREDGSMSVFTAQNVRNVPIAGTGQKSLQPGFAGSTDNSFAQQDVRSQSNFFLPSDFSKANDQSTALNQPQNVQGLLNMSKQRAYTKETDQSKLDTSNGGSQSLNISSFQGEVNTSTRKTSNLRQQKQRSDSQQAPGSERPQVNQTISAYTQQSAQNSVFNKKASHSLPVSEGVGSFQTSGKQIIQGQQTLLGQQKQQQQHVKMGDTANQTAQNKTLPLSVFEMQFYQGDFFMQSQQVASGGFQGGKVGLGFVPAGAKLVGPQPSNQLRLTANGQLQPQQQQQFMTKNGIQAASVGTIMKNGANLSDLSHQQQIERQKVNYAALQNFHQQWITTHGSNKQQQQQPVQHQTPQKNSQSMQWANYGGSQPNLSGAQTGQHHKSSLTPQKASNKHHGLISGGLMPQQNMNHSPIQLKQIVPQLLQQQMLSAVQSQGHMSQFGGPVQVNGRQMQVPNSQLTNAYPHHFSQLGQQVQLSQLQQQQLLQQQALVQSAHEYQYLQQQRMMSSSDMQQAYTGQEQANTSPNTSMINTTANQGEFLHLHLQQSAADQFSQQLYAMQLQSHQQAIQQHERLVKRRDANNIFKRAVSKIPFENAYVEDCYKFIIGYGNNSGLIRNALKQRSWWIEIQPVHSMFNFKWNPVSDGIKFARLGHHDFGKREQGTMGQKAKEKDGKNKESYNEPMQDKVNLQMVNHLEHHQLLTEKYNLLMVMQKFCDAHKENTFDLMPITFFVEIPDATRDLAVTQALAGFATLWHTLEANKDKLGKLKDSLIRQLHQRQELEEKEANETAAGAKPNQALQDKIQRLESVTGNSLSQPTNSGKCTKFKAFNFEKRTYQKFTMPLCHFDSYNLWILKPTHLNRGRGIHVFRDIETLHKLIKQYCIGKEEGSKKKDKDSQPKENPDKDANAANADPDNLDQAHAGFESEQEDPQPQAKTASPKKSTANKIKHNTFIIQKYIERPLLIFKRKFDIRVWVVLTQDQDLFFFKEGYLRTSSTEFGIDLQNIDNAFVHLTNNAIQKNAENYGDFEDGNQVSFPGFQSYIDEHYPESNVSVYNHLVPQMHEVILKTFNAVRRTIDPNRRKYCFELFGYDFILDDEFNSWLIEVNTNPCLEESSELLKRLLPRMIEDMLKLTVDVVFPKNSIRKRRDFSKKKSNGSPQKSSKKDNEIRESSTVKRVSTANKRSDKLQSTEEQNQVRYRGGQTTDTEQAAGDKDQRAVSRQKTQSTDVNSIEQTTNKLAQHNSDRGADFTSQAGFSQSLPDSDTGGATNEGGDKSGNNDVASPLMTIKEKLGRGRYYPVSGYSDTENMWHRLGNMDKDPIPNVTRHGNKKSVFSVQVQDKIFKLRKNPAYTGPLNLPVVQPDPSELIAKQDDAAEENQIEEYAGDDLNEKNTGDEDSH